jgi:tetratricopeptide (TPR) repeat protein
MYRAAAVFCIAAGALCIAAGARADAVPPGSKEIGPPPAKTPRRPEPQAPPADEPPTASCSAAAAREHYRRGTTLYDLGNYLAAAAEFAKAYGCRDDAVLLYNIAQSYRLARRMPEARDYYHAYLERAPRASNRAEVERKIADLDQQLVVIPIPR